jgi:hypothetical protein
VLKTLAITILFLCGVTLSLAQGQKPKTQSYDKFAVFGGYTYARDNGDPNAFNELQSNNYNDFSAYGLNGGRFAVTYYPTSHFGITTDFSFTSKSGNVPDATSIKETSKLQDYLIGPSYRIQLKGNTLSKVTLFGETLFGGSHVSVNFANSGSTSYYCTETSSGTPVATCSSYASAVVAGGGADIRVTRHLSVRPFQMDYWTHQSKLSDFAPAQTTEDDNSWEQHVKWSANGFRYSAGAVFNF